ncbi:DNA repair protein rad16 [Coelomomyces lativittatus]|nr:DNA repair protein rad16 [Coelomomyces lativittatus]
MLVRRHSPTLILAPTVALNQWHHELKSHVTEEGRFSIVLFHGGSRCTDPSLLLQSDIVLTSYAVLESCFRKEEYGFKRKSGVYKEPSVLHQLTWERVILDESHAIKDRVTNTARAVFHLQAKYKWALSGTPLQNRVGELYSVIRFLRLDPFAYYFCRACPCKSLFWKFINGSHCETCGHRPMQHFCHWNMSILKPIQNNGATGAGLIAFDHLGKLLDKYMLRRTKLEKADDLGLPPRHIVVRHVFFNEEEKDFYTSLYSDSKRQFATYVAAGTVLNHYANIFELLTKMRQAASHPDLVVSKFKQKLHDVCGICHDVAELPVIAKCKHVFCREDARNYIASCISPVVLCPICFSPFVVSLDDDEVILEKPVTGIVNKINMDMWRSSSKIEALVEELYRLKQESMCF